MADINNVTVVNNEVTNQQTNIATASSVVTSVVNNGNKEFLNFQTQVFLFK